MAWKKTISSLLWLLLMLYLRASIAKADWWDPDAFDDIQERMNAVTEHNCQDKSSDELHLPYEVLSQMPEYYRLINQDVPENRTNLLHLHNMALNRAMFYSYIMQRLNRSEDFQFQPGMMYYHLSAAADIGPNVTNIVNGTGIMYDTNCSYPNWYSDLPFNDTLPLFGPRARYIRSTSVVATTVLQDYGAGPNHDYTSDDYKINEWYRLFLPDDWDKAGLDPVRKYSYDVNITYGNGEGDYNHTQTTVFFGPALNPEPNEFLPVVFTSPYFDCGRANMWIVDAVSPVVDHLPRYLEWFHLRRHRFAAVSTQSIDFQAIDHNQCPLGIGNEPPNYLAGTARCKNTTFCHPISQYGFRRGGYECHCLPGLVYPPGQEGPFRGWHIEIATQEQYEEGFDCVTPTAKRSSPVTGGNEPRTAARRNTNKRRTVGEKITSRVVHDFGKQLSRRYNPESNKRRTQEIIQQKQSVNAHNCDTFPPEKLRLPQDATYGVKEIFANQSSTNIRLARFLSGYLQNLDGETNSCRNMRPDLPMHVEQYFGEALANVMGDMKIVASGVFFDENQFEGPLGPRRYFAPWVHKALETGMYPSQYKAYDLSGEGPGYLQEDWFAEVKARWSLPGFIDGLQRYEDTSYIRPDHEGSEQVKHVTYTSYTYYAVSTANDGFWDQAVFPCNGKLDTWQVTHSLPFFGPTSDKLDIEFKGVVTVTVLLDDLDINQCPMPLSEFNLFANTAVCPDKTKCTPTAGGGFQLDQYTCP